MKSIFSQCHDRGVQQSAPPTSRYIESLMCLIKFQSLALIYDRIQWKRCNPEILKTIKWDLEWDLKFYFLKMKSDEVGTTRKHPETINGNVKNLRKRIENEGKRECHFLL